MVLAISSVPLNVHTHMVRSESKRNLNKRWHPHRKCMHDLFVVWRGVATPLSPIHGFKNVNLYSEFISYEVQN